MTKEIKAFIFELARNKKTLTDRVSGECLSSKIFTEFGVNVSSWSVRRSLNTLLHAPRRLMITFTLDNNAKIKRAAFAKKMIERDIDSNEIFFTDEKRFLLQRKPNKATELIRLDHETYIKLRQGDPDTVEMCSAPIPVKSKSFMVAGGVSSKGVGVLNFVIGTMNSFCYKQTIANYKADMVKNGVKIFQQDNAPSHTSKLSTKELEEQFGENYINDWPPHSPDINPIETIWSIVETKLRDREYKNAPRPQKKGVGNMEQNSTKSLRENMRILCREVQNRQP